MRHATAIGAWVRVCPRSLRPRYDSYWSLHARSLEGARLSAIFDVRTAGLPHFKYQRREFLSKALALRRCFVDPADSGESGGCVLGNWTHQGGRAAVCPSHARPHMAIPGRRKRAAAPGESSPHTPLPFSGLKATDGCRVPLLVVLVRRGLAWIGPHV